jgi:CheY-like chemotaxis protein
MAKQAPILVADDDENDIFFLCRALERAGLRNPLIITHDGQEVIDYLGGAAPYADRARHPLPGLLLLDLKMPRMNGFEVLAWMEAHPEFNELPVVVFSSSSQEEDIRKARQLGADEYQIKPSDFYKLVQLVQEISARWLDPSTQEPRAS